MSAVRLNDVKLEVPKSGSKNDNHYPINYRNTPAKVAPFNGWMIDLWELLINANWFT